jgi:uncharacterized protein
MPRVVHFEIPAIDPKIVADFYTKVFDWKIEKWKNEDYWLVMTGDRKDPGIDGAIYPVNEMMNMMVNTISVDDLDGFMDKIKENGGEMITEPKDYPEVGRIAYFKDPEENVFGVMQFFPGAMGQNN